jgi:uncharacterized protein (TIGR03437 family)
MKQATDIRLLFLLAFPVLVPPAQAQSAPVTIDAVANSASYWRAGLNQVGIAQGSLFVVLGSNLGPSTLAQGQFPLPDQLGGSSVQIQVGSAVVPALLVYTVSHQICAVLPSRLDQPSSDLDH